MERANANEKIPNAQSISSSFDDSRSVDDSRSLNDSRSFNVSLDKITVREFYDKISLLSSNNTKFISDFYTIFLTLSPNSSSYFDSEDKKTDTLLKFINILSTNTQRKRRTSSKKKEEVRYWSISFIILLRLHFSEYKNILSTVESQIQGTMESMTSKESCNIM